MYAPSKVTALTTYFTLRPPSVRRSEANVGIFPYRVKLARVTSVQHWLVSCHFQDDIACTEDECHILLLLDPFLWGRASETKVSAYNEGGNNGSAERSEVRPTDRQVMPEASEAATVEQQADDPF